MSKQILEFLIGLPASGKSTYAKNKVVQDPDNWVRLNRDDIRRDNNLQDFSKEKESKVLEIEEQLLTKALSEGK